MDKIVNIYPTWPITRLNPPIRSVVKNVTKSVEDIRICLVTRARVEEVLPDGSTVTLGFNNYDEDNSIKTTKTEETVDVDKTDTTSEVTEQAIVEENPVVEEEAKVATEQPKPIEQHFGKHGKKHRNRYNNKPNADDSNNGNTDSVAEATVSADDEVTVETIDVESIL